MTNEQRNAAAALLKERVPEVVGIGRLFARHGHELALVGGPVRDVFRGERPADLDLTTDATPEQVLAVVERWADAIWTVGIAFGTVGLRKGSSVFEITTYRSEQYQASSRKPEVRYGRSLEEDLSRRDFTINAMAARLPGYELVDPFGGLDALRERVLRTPGRPEDSFSDDPLRIMRAARFVAKLGFTVAPEVRAAMTEQAARLEIVSAERIAGELTKLMLAPDPARGIDLLVQTGAADEVLPEVSRLRMEADEHHRHKDVYEHSLTVLRAGHRAGAAVRAGRRPDRAAGRAAARHRQAEDPVAAARRAGRVPPARGGRREAGPAQADRAALPERRGARRVRAGRAAPAVPRLR